ncbi:MarR family transcriptional regulator [Actinomyces sp. 2119]|uniref:MarR family transcriptional regulator n=1 Tax=Actinomyces lilanjuaniae TaxID=2321394 RepID=A0ABM6Z2B5_9ACTO|nr:MULTISPECIES: helix-turn-helix domain-containing protein [Actinomyces]AYD89388.1 MarR family transcriptional regulator [Actinomyces lilanjuaniae]RJF43258.1 MarR family transcriptional regulator [Actinomyces sp. 2119]
MHNSSLTSLPRPALNDLSARADLSAARRRVLEIVEASAEPMTAVQIADALNLHHNTVREHLDALAAAGFIAVSTRPTGKRGRPALRYSSTAPDPRQVVESYVHLLDSIAQTLDSREDARAMALEIGRLWAEHTPVVLETATAAGNTVKERMTALLPHLAMMGFAPEVNGDDIVLRSCPLVTQGHTPHSLLCTMHEGFLRAVADLDDEPSDRDPNTVPERIRVIPFAGDGCHLRANVLAAKNAEA